MRERRVTFSHLLPIIDLALLVVLVFVPITLAALHLYEASKGSDQVQIRFGEFDAIIARDQIVPWAIRMETMPKAHTIKALNLPGVLFDILVSLPTSWPSTWHPQALLPDTWDALVYPFYCLPFWWLVGRGLDGMIYNERIHWSLVLLGTLLCGVCLVLALGLHFCHSTSDREDTGWLITACVGWTIAFAVLPITGIKQRTSVRKARLA